MTKVDIIYCRPCGYEKRARTAADALQQALGVNAQIVPGGGGIFEVRVNDCVVARRTREHFPNPAEIVELVSQSLDQNALAPHSTDRP